MSLDDARGNGKAESGTALLGAEEWIKEPGLELWRNPCAGIFNLNENAGLTFVLDQARAFAHAKRHCARPGNALGGVAHQVDKRLFELMRVGTDVGTGRSFKLKADCALRILALHKLVDVRDQGRST